MREELLVFLGFEELLSLIKIKEIHDEGKYDVLIVDCAPTGETMSLLKLPDLFKWWMEKIFPIKLIFIFLIIIKYKNKLEC